MKKKELPEKLQSLVSWSVALLGEAIKAEFGAHTFRRVDSLRKCMKNLRGLRSDDAFDVLQREFHKVESWPHDELGRVAHSFSLMLELINRCETAYRAWRLEDNRFRPSEKRKGSVIFVLTAHPTEARSPQILSLFGEIEELLSSGLRENKQEVEKQISHLLRIALYIPMSRRKKPTVEDEAQHIFSFVLAERILNQLTALYQSGVTVTLRSWVGGDKDGHPGVDEKALAKALNLSRKALLDHILKKTARVRKRLHWVDSRHEVEALKSSFSSMEASARTIKNVSAGDGARVMAFRNGLDKLVEAYEQAFGLVAPELKDAQDLVWLFPAIVLPLELREDSSVVREALKSPGTHAIGRMLGTIKSFSKGHDPKWYARGLVLSMVETSEDLNAGLALAKKVLGGWDIPVVPLFENEVALTNAKTILEETFKKNPTLPSWHKKRWNGRFEVMVGYSDSAKENGVLSGRLLIAKALGRIDRALRKETLTPVFFHGSGGSVERGGGSIKEQTQWWPKSAIQTFKATIQGEMVARTFSRPEILLRYVERIWEQAIHAQNTVKVAASLEKLASETQRAYREAIHDKEFMDVVACATPYGYLDQLRIGSRPSRRKGGLDVGKLRAIPWILCWTQTRVLFPTWWGVGSAFDKLSAVEKNELKIEFKEGPFFSSFVKVLAFSLRKVELSVWRTYLEQNCESTKAKEIYDRFEKEYKLALKFVKAITGHRDLMWFRPWLGESVALRSSMVHPLNMAQILALKRGDMDLLRETVTGVACGMLTTG